MLKKISEEKKTDLGLFGPIPKRPRDDRKTKPQLIREVKLLRKRVRRFRFFSDNTNEGIFLSSIHADGKSGQYVEVNESACRRLGYNREEILALPPPEIYSPESRPTLSQFLKEVMTKGSSTAELVHMDKAGKKIPVEVSSHFFPLHRKRMVLSIVRDITERKQAEEALQASEQRYRDLYRMARLMCDNVPDMIWAKDLEKRFLFVNRAMCFQFLGARDTDEPLGKTDLFFAEREKAAYPEQPEGPRFGEICVNSDEVVIKNRKAQRFDEFGRVRGKFFFLDVHKAPFWDEKGQMIGTVGCGRDVTREKRLEEEQAWAKGELADYQKNLEKIVEERTARIHELEQQRVEIEKWVATGHLAAQVAHEINNPLAGIKNSLLLVKDAVSRDHPYYPYLGRIEREIDRIARIVRQVFDLYRPQEESKAEFSIEKTIQDVVSLLAEDAQRYNVQFDLKVAPAILKIPENSVRQVLFNILKNAIEVSPSNGGVRVEMEAGERFFGIRISDEGPGIPAEMRPHIFKPFFTTKRGGQRGMGLGLSISNDIVQALGGDIGFESEPGQGTVFKINLPWRMGRKEENRG